MYIAPFKAQDRLHLVFAIGLGVRRPDAAKRNGEKKRERKIKLNKLLINRFQGI